MFFFLTRDFCNKKHISNSKFNFKCLRPTPTNSFFCDGDSITFTASSTSAISTYTFSVGGVTYQTSSTNIFEPSNLTPPILITDGAEVVVIAETDDSCSASATILMNENLVSPGTNKYNK